MRKSTIRAMVYVERRARKSGQGGASGRGTPAPRRGQGESVSVSNEIKN